MRIHRVLPIAAVSLALFGSGTASAQTDEEKAAARALAVEGAEAFQAKKYGETVDLVSRAEAVFHAPTHLLLIGRAQVALGKLVAARETFLKVTREQLAPNAPSVFKKAQQEAKEELAAIEPRIGSIRVTLTGPGAAEAAKVTVKLDETVVPSALVGVYRPIDPGKHAVTALVPGRDPVKQDVSFGDGEKKDISLEVQTATEAATTGPTDGGQTPVGSGKTPDKPATGSSTLRLVGITGMALGGVGIVVGGVFTGLWSTKQNEADREFGKCNQPCTPALQDSIKALDNAAAARGTIALTSLVAGLVLGGGGVALYMLGRKPADKPANKPAAAFVLPFITPNGAGLVGSF